jgi:hypothetical protein
MKTNLAKSLFGILVLLCLSTSAFSEELSNVVKSYIKNFNSATTLDTRIKIVMDASKQKRDDMGPFYKEALIYLATNYPHLMPVQKINQLALTCIEQVKKLKYAGANYQMWILFDLPPDSLLIIRILEAIAVTGKGDMDSVKRLNAWLDKQNSIFQTGTLIDEHILNLGLAAIKELADESSFPFVFKASILGYSKVTSQAALDTLLALKADFKKQVINILERFTFLEKKQILIFSLASDRLTDPEKGEIAQFALNLSLTQNSSVKEEQQTVKEIRMIAVEGISRLKWDKAEAIVIENYTTTRDEYIHGEIVKSNKSDFLVAISHVGNLKSERAAYVLNDELKKLNFQTETTSVADEQVVMALMASLARIGNPLAYDAVKYVQFLNYSETVKEASRKAVESLD